nr:MAG TPA: hypothetical protein [Bacteriophage sp.]
MKNRIDSRNEKYDQIRFTFSRRREDGRTLYIASATPCRLETCGGLTFEKYEPRLGYRATLLEVPRASSKALAQARVELWRFVCDVLHVLSNEGYAPAYDDSELDKIIDEIAANLECEAF